ncbi:hypothetical protein Skr01_40100 [Sphaerisporangium krabiense]|uniref:Kef-type K+ transport system membrane component KefB n=1 Tax=Sphaerisporangium krabiense TaxID=763782 RepID=A0A7W8Z9K7_9ACTN|nr:cation:proton antiporter [Sphaerisporangium krabiense]MBB5629825.1 Kef-type K+ transport system membrane component KefB [Sphaerisporangium krabiense]GII63925.1 hypothetical protein Skr01_40100 [Sphaerisporangium krabiense]
MSRPAAEAAKTTVPAQADEGRPRLDATAWAGPRPRAAVPTYLLVVAVPALIALALLLTARESSGPRTTGGPVAADHGVQLFISFALVILAAELFGRFAVRLGQPMVVGEIFAGICLGPSVLGGFAPGVVSWLFPAELRPVLQGLADLGLVALMFCVGQETRHAPLKGQRRTAMAVAHAGIAGPFLGGVLLATFLYRDWAGPQANPVIFAMFLGSALSITAFPVLARILVERDMLRTMAGRLSMLCAAIADVVAWCLIAAMTAVAGRDTPAHAVITVVLVVVYGAAMATLGRRLLERLFAALEGRGDELRLLVLLAGLLLSAAATSAIGIHAIFGAFLYGLCCPTGALSKLTEQINVVSATLLLPFFFVGTGLRTDIWRSGFDLGLAGVTALIVVVAMAGKVAGPVLMARASGLGRHDAATVGVLLNTRGLTELVVLNLGLALGLLGDRLFVALVLMALITTAMTAPLLGLLNRSGISGRQASPRRL